MERQLSKGLKKDLSSDVPIVRDPVSKNKVDSDRRYPMLTSDIHTHMYTCPRTYTQAYITHTHIYMYKHTYKKSV